MTSHCIICLAHPGVSGVVLHNAHCPNQSAEIGWAVLPADDARIWRSA